jgi:dipeptidyl aminopeptidase/acylaminoacyl peptidase
MSLRRPTAVVAVMAAVVTPSLAQAQDRAPSVAAQAAAAKGSRPITAADIKAWNSIRQTALSSDGRYFAYVVAPAEGNATLVVRGTAQGAPETRIPVGENGGSISISGDSRWLGFIVAPPRVDSAARGRGAGGARGGGGGGGGGGGARGGAQGSEAASSRPPANRFVLLNLATGERKEFDRIRRFSFNADTATWVAMQGYPVGGAAETPAGGAGGRGGGGRGGAPPAGGATPGGGANLLLYDLASGEQFNMGLVGEYAFNDRGDWLAYTMEAPDQVGNGVQLRNMTTNVVRSVDSERVLYRHLAWVDSSVTLSVMRGRIDEAARDTVFSTVAFTDFGANGPARKLVFDPAGRSDFPAGWKLASDRAPRYAADLSSVFVGIRETPRRPQLASGRGASPIQPGAPGAGGTVNQTGGRGGAAGGNAADETSLILWHANDPRLQSQQIVQEQADRSFNYLSAYRFAENRFIRLVTDSLRAVSITPGDRYAYGTDVRAYQREASYSGRNYLDVYAVDLATGAQRLLMKRKPAVGPMIPSPDGRRLLYWGRDGHYWVLDLATGDTVNITRGAPVSFVNTEDDHNNLYPPPTPARGWTTDSRAVLLYDNWDVWKVPVEPRGARAVNLTGDGRRTQVRYTRLYQFADGAAAPLGGRGGGPAAGIDVSKPLYFGTYGEWTKKEGLSRVDPGQSGASRLFFDDARFNVTRARDADTWLFTRSNFTEYPDYWVANPDFQGGYRITDVNPQLSELTWSSGTRLIDYRSDKGDRLQGALYLPANYEPGKKYPLLVTIYEKRSQNMRSFVSPTDTRAPDPALYTSRGYAVLDPDIVYRVNDPGMSAVWCVIPAVKAAIATGLVDDRRIGLWGHSWGGYQTAFLVTQTNLFAAAVAGAPLTDMVSMYSSVYWNTGGANQAIFESSQGRFKGNFLDNYDAYIRNSPAFHANKVTTPLMLLHNDKDGAVDFNQGITYFNTLRQLEKKVVLLEYVGENHGLARPVNQRDYAVRMSEWFDHHLKGTPPADWITNGVPRLRMTEHLESRRDSAGRIIVP